MDAHFSLAPSTSVPREEPSRDSQLASFRKQAEIRLALGTPIVLYGFWAASHLDNKLAYGAGLALLHLAYILLAWSYGRRRAAIHTWAPYMTAIADPALMSAWLAFTEEWGAIFLGFYLFTTLGYGFRMGLKLMRVCQVASVAGFVFVVAFAPYWRDHLIAWLAFLLPLFFVPAYARSLIVSLHHALARAETLSEAKSNMLAKVSHELRTPLNGIMASAELLQGHLQGAPAAALLSTIESASKDLLREINNLLDLRKLESQAVQLEARPFAPAQVVKQVYLTLRATALSKHLQIHESVDYRGTNFYIGDPYYLQQVLMNLVGNAIKFTSTGFVRITAEIASSTEHSDMWRFSVEDSGIGIPKHALATIFEPFVQAESSTTRRFGGTGLGTAIAKQLVQLMGGELRVESEEGVGSKFSFTIELRHANEHDLLQRNGSSKQEPEPALRGKRILVADDNTTNLLIVRAMLERDGHEVSAATSGDEALLLLCESSFDLVILDYNLGGMTGSDVMRAYRMGRIDSAPILFITADATEETARTLLSAGADGILTKPISLSSLRSSISAILGHPLTPQRESSDEGSTPPSPMLTVVQTSPIDEATLARLRHLSQDTAFFPRLLEQSREEIRTYAARARHAVETEDLAEMRFAAHTLKGVAQNIGAIRLGGLGRDLMQLPETQWREKATTIMRDICREEERVSRELSKILDEVSETSPS